MSKTGDTRDSGSEERVVAQSEDGSAPKSRANSGEVSSRNTLNDLTAKEWIAETVSVWPQKGLGASHAEAQIERQHPAPFSFTDVARLVRFFTKSGGVVLDPFVGVGSALKAAALEGRSGIGFELSDRYADLAIQRLQEEVPDPATREMQTVVRGDARDLIPKLEDDSVDFVVTSPPYWNILHKEDHKARQERTSQGLDARYGDDPRDLGNISDYDEFLEEVTGILGLCGRPLKPRKYMAVVVGDFRNGGRYHMFHADLARSLESHGMVLKGLTILYQRHKRVFPYGYPAAYVPNLHHQYIVILRNEA